MTAPFAPPPPPEALVVGLAMLGVAIAMPFARREDALGRVAAAVVLAAALATWGVLLRGWARALIRWWRGGRGG